MTRFLLVAALVGAARGQGTYKAGESVTLYANKVRAPPDAVGRSAHLWQPLRACLRGAR